MLLICAGFVKSNVCNIEFNKKITNIKKFLANKVQWVWNNHIKLRSYETLTKNDQNFCNGNNDVDIVNKFLDKLDDHAPKGIRFNRANIVSRQDDGHCTAITLDFLSYLKKHSKKKDADKLIFKAGKRYDEVEGKNRKTIGAPLRSIQCALNCIECDTSQSPKADFSYKKAKSLLSSHDFKIGYASEKFNYGKDKSKKLAKMIEALPVGVYFLRVLKLENTKKLEKWGHSLVYIKGQKSSHYYDCNLGLEKISRNVGDRMYKNLTYNFNRWKVTEARFYQIKDLDLESNPKMLNIIQEKSLVLFENTRKLAWRVKSVASSFISLLGRIFKSIRRS